MKHLAIILAFITTTVFADNIEIGYEHKDKIQNAADHNVYSLAYNVELSKQLQVGVKTENETVVTSQNVEGLIQAQGKYSFINESKFTPYVNAAYGQKFKNGTNFDFWVAGVGVKTQFGDVTTELGWRHREALDSTNSYNTDETSIKASISPVKNHVVGIKYAQERGTSNYNTTGAFYQVKF